VSATVRPKGTIVNYKKLRIPLIGDETSDTCCSIAITLTITKKANKRRNLV